MGVSPAITCSFGGGLRVSLTWCRCRPHASLVRHHRVSQARDEAGKEAKGEEAKGEEAKGEEAKREEAEREEANTGDETRLCSISPALPRSLRRGLRVSLTWCRCGPHASLVRHYRVSQARDEAGKEDKREEKKKKKKKKKK